MGGRGASSGRKTMGTRNAKTGVKIPVSSSNTSELESYYQKQGMSYKQRIKDIDSRIKEVNNSGKWQPDVIDSLAELKEYYEEIM